MNAGKCPTGAAWADIAIGTDIAHQPALCSNRGICDTATGQCKCMEGYEGLGCSRSESQFSCLCRFDGFAARVLRGWRAEAGLSPSPVSHTLHSPALLLLPLLLPLQ